MRERGFTYLGILFAIAIMGAVLAATGMVWKTISQRDKEAELLFIGHAFRTAIGLYYDNTPGAAKQYPKKLDDLLEDKRYPVVKRYLRKLYVDPLTGKKEWGAILGPGGVITGVYSLSSASPIKVANFDEADKDFEGATSFQKWAFSHKPGTPAAPATSTVPNAPAPAIAAPAPGGTQPAPTVFVSPDARTDGN